MYQTSATSSDMRNNSNTKRSPKFQNLWPMSRSLRLTA
jgi:hypothetical protein